VARTVKKWVSAAVLAVAVLLAGCAPVGPAGLPGLGAAGSNAVDEATPPFFSKKIAMGHVRELAKKVGVRVRATKGERQGAKYIASRFEELGYEVTIQKFSVDGSKSRNVRARWPDIVKRPIVVGGHMDSVPKSPGANDNASGIAVVLEMARIFAGAEQAGLVEFVAFGAEEYGADGTHHVGSQKFVNRLGKKGRKRSPGMISVDMIADGKPLIIGTAGIGPEVVAKTVFRKIKKKTRIKVEYRTTCDCSDNGPFERAGIPGAFMWSGSEPDYHSPSDKVANLNPDHLRRTGRAVRAFLKGLDADMLTRFRTR
jgi:Peptidase family M28